MARERKRKFSYKRRTKEQVAHRSTQTGYAEGDPYIKNSIKLFTPKEGDNTLRILPPTWEDADHYGIDIFMHYQVGSDKNSYICPERQGTGNCPMCEERHRLEAEGEGDSDYAKSLRTSKRVLVYIIDRDDESEGILAWAMSWTMDRDFCKLAIDKRTGEVYALDDPEEGYDIEFSREGKGIQTKYTGVAIARRASALDNEEALDAAVENPIPDIIKVYDTEHLSKAFGAIGNDAKVDDTEGRDSAPKKGTQKTEVPEEQTEYTLEGLDDMDFDDLLDIMDEEKLDIEDSEDLEEDELRKAIAEGLGIAKPKRRSRRSLKDE